MHVSLSSRESPFIPPTSSASHDGPAPKGKKAWKKQLVPFKTMISWTAQEPVGFIQDSKQENNFMNPNLHKLINEV